MDTASLYYRSYYALPESMTAPDGTPHQAIRGLLTTMTRLIQLHRPQGLAACWDDDWRPQWRVDLLPSYKTHRLQESGPDGEAGESVPDTLGPQIDAIAQILDALGLPRPGAVGFEADDVIATLAARSRSVVVVTGDRDLVQVIRPGVLVHLAVNGGMDTWPMLDEQAARERFGVPADRYVDLAILRGDPSDGIPGVPGFGAKTATAVIEAYGSVAQALNAARGAEVAKPLTPRLAGLLIEHADSIRAMREVATARTDAPVLDPIPLGRLQTDEERLATLSTEWGVTRFVDDLRGAIAQTVEA